MNPFPPEVRTASIVPRWSVVWTLNKDTVANHSFYVALYADAIARLINWPGDRGDLLYLALTHDLGETVSGDIVSPVKRAAIDIEKLEAYIDKKMEIRMPAVMSRLAKTSEDGRAVVKVADCLDAVLFLIVEERMGNLHVSSRTPGAMENLKDAWFNLPAPAAQPPIMWDNHLEKLWMEVVLPSIDAHRRVGGSGV